MARDMRTGALEGLQGHSEVMLRTLKSVGRTIRGTLREWGLNPSRRKLLRQADEEAEAMMQTVKCLVALGHVAATGVPPAGQHRHPMANDILDRSRGGRSNEALGLA